MKFIDLFAGIGGFHLGLEQAGHECVGWVEWDKFARQSYQAIHDGADKLWNEKDINDVKAVDMPKADLWAFGFPCQDISVAGKQGGFTNGKRSSLFFTVTGLLRELKEEDKPKYLLVENVKNLLSINKGWDFAKLQIELDEIGYDIEWDVLNSAEVVPQHRERIYIVGHLRGTSTRKIFPIQRENRQVNHSDETSSIEQIGNASGSQSFGGNPQVGRVYLTSGISPTLMARDYKGPKQIIVPVLTPDRINKRQNGRRFKDNGEPEFTVTAQDRHGVLIVDDQGRTKKQLELKEQVPTLRSRSHGNESKVFVKEATKQGYAVAEPGDSINISQPNSKTRRGRVGKQKANTLLTGEEQATLLSDLRIRKLTPLECWRLQGFPDWAFNRAREAGLSNSQLYKQAGNSVTVSVVHAIAERLDDEEITEKFPN